jgi:hypothetical protein
MPVEVNEQSALWREDSAVWELIAGELVLQQNTAAARSSALLLAEARARAADAAGLTRGSDLDKAGHAMIGCTLALALAARSEAPSEQPAESYAADLAADIAWGAQEPDAQDLDRLTEAIGRFADGDQPDAARRIMKLAVRAGGYAAGLSPHITRRRQRRDLLEPPTSGTEQ